MKNIISAFFLLSVLIALPQTLLAENIKGINNILKNNSIKSTPSQVDQPTSKIDNSKKIINVTSKELAKTQDTMEMSLINSYVAGISALFSKPLLPAKTLKNNLNLPVKSKRISLFPQSPVKQSARIKEDQPGPILELNAIERDYYKITNDTLQQDGPALLKRCEAMISTTFSGFNSEQINKLFQFASNLHVRLIHGIPPSGNPDFVYPRIEYMQEMYSKLNYPNYRSWVGLYVRDILVLSWKCSEAMDWLVKVKEEVFDKITDFKDKLNILYGVGNAAFRCAKDKMDDAHFLLGQKYYKLTIDFMSDLSNFPPDQYENIKNGKHNICLNESSVYNERYERYWEAIVDLEIVINERPIEDSMNIQAVKRRDAILNLLKQPKVVKLQIFDNKGSVSADKIYKVGDKFVIKAYVENTTISFPPSIGIFMSSSTTSPSPKILMLYKSNDANETFLYQTKNEEPLTVDTSLVNNERDKLKESISYVGGHVGSDIILPLYNNKYLKNKSLRSTYKNVIDVDNLVTSNSTDFVLSGGSEFLVFSSIDKKIKSAIMIQNQTDWFSIIADGNEANGAFTCSVADGDEFALNMRADNLYGKYDEDVDVLVLIICYALRCEKNEDAEFSNVWYWYNVLPKGLILGYSSKIGNNMVGWSLQEFSDYIGKSNKLTNEQILNLWFDVHKKILMTNNFNFFLYDAFEAIYASAVVNNCYYYIKLKEPDYDYLFDQQAIVISRSMVNIRR